MRHHYKKLPEIVPKAEAWFLVIVGIILGTVFTFGMHYWESSISKEDAVYTEAVFESYEIIYTRRYKLKEIKVVFQDREPLFIDGSCCSQTVLDKMAVLESGAVLCMYVHPNSSKLLDIQNGNDSILLFDNAIAKLSSEVSGFMYFGIFLYLAALCGGIKLIRKEVY